MREKPLSDYYDKTLKEIAKCERGITVKKWNKIAIKKNLLSAVALRGLTKLTWNETCRKARTLYS